MKPLFAHLCCILILACVHGFGQSPIKPFAIGDTIDGGKIITALAEDDTYYWIGTNKGVIRQSLKSSKRKIFTTTNSMLPNNYITCICARKNGHIWIGTPEGICLNDGYSFLLMTTENTELPDDLISSIAEDANEIIWIGTRKKGLVKVKKNNYQTYNTANSNLPSNQILSIKQNKNGNLTVITLLNETIDVTSLKIK